MSKMSTIRAGHLLHKAEAQYLIAHGWVRSVSTFGHYWIAPPWYRKQGIYAQGHAINSQKSTNQLRDEVDDLAVTIERRKRK